MDLSTHLQQFTTTVYAGDYDASGILDSMPVLVRPSDEFLCRVLNNPGCLGCEYLKEIENTPGFHVFYDTEICQEDLAAFRNGALDEGALVYLQNWDYGNKFVVVKRSPPPSLRVHPWAEEFVRTHNITTLEHELTDLACGSQHDVDRELTCCEFQDYLPVFQHRGCVEAGAPVCGKQFETIVGVNCNSASPRFGEVVIYRYMVEDTCSRVLTAEQRDLLVSTDMDAVRGFINEEAGCDVAHVLACLHNHPPEE